MKEHGYNVTSISIGSHTGTHIDAPYHFLDAGATIDKVDLSVLVGEAAIVDVRQIIIKPRQRIFWDDIRSIIDESLASENACKIVLFVTGWSKHWKTPKYVDHPFFDKTVAEGLLQLDVRVVGVDTLSPDEVTVPDESASEEPSGDYGFHDTFLGAEGLIVENLVALESLPSSKMSVSLLPLKLVGCDGSPIRAVAWN
jgi:kynurenine formamidase